MVQKDQSEKSTYDKYRYNSCTAYMTARFGAVGSHPGRNSMSKFHNAVLENCSFHEDVSYH